MRLVDRALDRCKSEGRNDTGAWLATQLRDNGYSRAAAERFTRVFARRTPTRNLKGQAQPYTEAEALATVRLIYLRPPRTLGR
jgi:hypothetical protein